jgi:NAD(P)-dependent dehydrogenase (short-subunit alcohol dehydrogenase family)
MNEFKDKVAIITGAASGIGRALALELGRSGSIVVAADINPQGANDTALAIKDGGAHAYAEQADVSSAEDVERIIEETAARFGRLDYVFNNAGIGVGGEALDLKIDHWQMAINVNLWGVIYGSHAAYRVMAGQGFGHIINIASLAGLIASPGLAPYSATKHAVVGLSKALRAEGEDLGVRVSVVCPGLVKTGIYEASTVINADKEKLFSNIPFRMIESEKAARLILRGVSRNQALIIFPFHARALWWLARLSPAMIAPFARKSIRDLRASRS